MKHFRRIACGIDTSALRAFLDHHPELWGGWMRKHETPTMHGVKPRMVGELPFAEAIREGKYREALFLRWVIRSGQFLDCAPGIDEAAPWARDTLSTIAALIRSTEIGKISLVRLRNGEAVPPHIDGGTGGVCADCQASEASECQYFTRYPNRFHCVITSNPDCWFVAGGEKVCMAPGELWWFNQKVEHGVTNAGTADRIHLIVDAEAAA